MDKRSYREAVFALLLGTPLQLFVAELAKNVEIKLNMTQSLCVFSGRTTISLTTEDEFGSSRNEVTWPQLLKLRSSYFRPFILVTKTHGSLKPSQLQNTI